MNQSVKTLGIFILLVAVVAFTVVYELIKFGETNFLNYINLANTARWTGIFGILSIGVAFVIITGGIDLSIGSVVGLVAVVTPYLVVHQELHPSLAILAALVISAAIGLAHGLLITKLKLQPFIVTLCGLLIYRGISRWFVDDETQGFAQTLSGIKPWAKNGLFTNLFGEPLKFGGFIFDIPMAFVYLSVFAVIGMVLLGRTVWGRYLLALGNNEEAAKFSGVRTDRTIILAYVICSLMAGVGGVLLVLDLNSAQPSNTGNFYELYAIAAAVLGGCSLRGGEGSILGVVIGAALLRVLYNAINLLGISTTLEFSIIGFVILGGAMADELIRRYATRRRGSAGADKASPPPVAQVPPVPPGG